MNKQIHFKQLIPNTDYDPKNKDSRPLMWDYQPANRSVQVGDVVSFLCNGRGRGGHYRVTAKVTKVNRKTFRALEQKCSYSPGTDWIIHLEQHGNDTSDIYIELTIKE